MFQSLEMTCEIEEHGADLEGGGLLPEKHEQGLQERKPRHFPAEQQLHQGEEEQEQDQEKKKKRFGCRGGFVGQEEGRGVVLALDFPVLLRAQLCKAVIKASIKSPAFGSSGAARALQSRSYVERRPKVQTAESCALEVLQGIQVKELGDPLAHAHVSTLCIQIHNPCVFPIRLLRLWLAEGSAKYYGPAGVEPFALGELFAVRVDHNNSYKNAKDDDQGTLLSSDDSCNVLLSVRPKPSAYVQYTHVNGYFAARLVAVWSAPDMRGRVMSWMEVTWKGPRTNDLLVLCRVPPPAPSGAQFVVDVTVDNISDSSLVLTLGMGKPRRLVSSGAGAEEAVEDGGLICLDQNIIVGTLTPKSKTSVFVRFVGIKAGIYQVSDIRVTDTHDIHTLVDPWVIQVL